MQQEIVTYCRVSTEMQGIGGLGMAAQRAAVNSYAERRGLPIVAAYEEVGSGRKERLEARPELTKAVAHARRSGALLVIARLDRLARNVYVTSQLLESGVEFICCDNPHANRLTLHILSAMAEYEGRLISERTKAGLAAAKARGVKLGNGGRFLTPEVCRRAQLAAGASHVRRAKVAYADLVPLIVELRTSGKSLNGIAIALNAIGHRTQRRMPWSIACVRRLLVREGRSDLLPPSFIVKTTMSAESTRRRIAASAITKRENTRAAYATIAPQVIASYETGMSLQSIARQLNDSGHRPQFSKTWRAITIKNLLKREGVPIRWSDGSITAQMQRQGVRAAVKARCAASDAFRNTVLPAVRDMREKGLTYKKIAGILNRRKKRTRRGKRWTDSLVWIMLNRPAGETSC